MKQELKKVESIDELPKTLVSDIQYVERLRAKVKKDREDLDDIEIISRNIRLSLEAQGYDPAEYDRLRTLIGPGQIEKGEDREIA